MTKNVFFIVILADLEGAGTISPPPSAQVASRMYALLGLIVNFTDHCRKGDTAT